VPAAAFIYNAPAAGGHSSNDRRTERMTERIEHAPVDLARALEAIRRTQRRWLADLEQACDGEPRFLDAFRRWEEQLTLLKLQLHRAEQRLLHYLLLPEDRRPWRELPGPAPSSQETYQRWMHRVGPYMRSLHIDSSYRRVAHVLDPQEEAVTADVVTDIVALAELAQSTCAALDRLQSDAAADCLQDLAFFHVISPWKQLGMPALFDVLRWINAFLGEHDEF